MLAHYHGLIGRLKQPERKFDLLIGGGRQIRRAVVGVRLRKPVIATELWGRNRSGDPSR